jgi:hypothetical protein
VAAIDILNYLDLANLTDEQKAQLTRRLQRHRRELRAALDAVEQGLAQLGQGPAQPPSGARRTRRTNR